MKRYRFVNRLRLAESALRDPDVLELVRNMTIEDILKALFHGLGLEPDTAAQTAGSLIRHANDAMSMPYRDQQVGVDAPAPPDRDLEKLARRREKGQVESFGMGAADAPILTYLFPDEEEEDSEWPYDAATKGVMNSPLAAGPRMTT